MHVLDGLGLPKIVVCVDCKATIVRCRNCWKRFAHILCCVNCTGGKGAGAAEARKMHRPEDGEFDIDANGWYSNARRLLEDGGADLAGDLEGG